MSSATSSAASSAEPGPPRPVDPRGPCGAQAPEEAVDAAVAALAGLADRPLAEHVAVFEQVHAALGHALADGASGRRRCRDIRPGVTAVVTRARLDAELVRRGLARSASRPRS